MLWTHWHWTLFTILHVTLLIISIFKGRRGLLMSSYTYLYILDDICKKTLRVTYNKHALDCIGTWKIAATLIYGGAAKVYSVYFGVTLSDIVTDPPTLWDSKINNFAFSSLALSCWENSIKRPTIIWELELSVSRISGTFSPPVEDRNGRARKKVRCTFLFMRKGCVTL